MNKVLAFSVTGALLFGGGVGYLVTDTVAKNSAEEVKAQYERDLTEAEDSVASCKEFVKMTGEVLTDFENYFYASNEYVANLPHPGVQLDGALADASRVVADEYLFTGWMDVYEEAKVSCNGS